MGMGVYVSPPPKVFTSGKANQLVVTDAYGGLKAEPYGVTTDYMLMPFNATGRKMAYLKAGAVGDGDYLTAATAGVTPADLATLFKNVHALQINFADGTYTNTANWYLPPTPLMILSGASRENTKVNGSITAGEGQTIAFQNMTFIGPASSSIVNIGGGASAYFYNCTFTGNSSPKSANGVNASASTVYMYNCSFTNCSMAAVSIVMGFLSAYNCTIANTCNIGYDIQAGVGCVSYSAGSLNLAATKTATTNGLIV